MYIFGKIFGGVFGALIGGPLGLMLGVAVGHVFDKGLALNVRLVSPNTSEAKKVFFKSTFIIMGYIAKIDGRVSEKEIQKAREVMAHLQLNHEQKLIAMQCFNIGKSPHFKWETSVENFIKNCGHQPQLIQLFVEIQIQCAFVEGVPNYAKQRVLEQLCDKLHIPRSVLAQMEAQYRAQRKYSHRTDYAESSPSIEDELSHSYTILGISDKSTDAQIKKAYRKLMSQHHPDKLVAKGLPTEMVKVATEKTQRIQKAYEQICKSRGIK